MWELEGEGSFYVRWSLDSRDEREGGGLAPKVDEPRVRK